MDMVRELTTAAVLAAALIAVFAFLKGRARHAAPGLIAFVVILTTQATVLASDVVERGLLGLLRWMAEGSSVLRTGSTIGVPGSAPLYPDDPEQLSRLIHGFQDPLLLGLALLLYVPLIFTVLASRHEDRGFLVAFGLYFLLITGVGTLWAHGLGTEAKFFSITWRYGSRGHWLSAMLWMGLIFGLPMALAKAKEAAEAAEDSFGPEFSLRTLAGQFFVMATLGTAAVLVVSVLYQFRAPPVVQVIAGLTCSLGLQAVLSGVADPDADGLSPVTAIRSWAEGASDAFSDGWREGFELVLERVIVLLLGTATIAGFFVVGGLTLMSILFGEEPRNILLLVGAGIPFLLLIGVPGTGEYLGAVPGIFRKDS